MAHLLRADETSCNLIHSDGGRSDPVARRNSSRGYQFGRMQGKRVGSRRALRRINGYFKNMIETIANAKLRRMQRKLELRGTSFDQPNNDWVTRKRQPTECSR
jgi:hypothetical protein